MHLAPSCITCPICCLSAGLPALDIPPLDPLSVPEVLLDYRSDATDGKMIVRNSQVIGLKDIDIWNLRSVPAVVRVANSSHTETTERGPTRMPLPSGSLIAVILRPRREVPRARLSPLGNP
jgi:hypothetical protein